MTYQNVGRTITDVLEVTSWWDSDFSLDLHEECRALTVYLSLAEAADLADALNDHINRFEGETS